MGRRPIGDRPMSAAERQRRRRAGQARPADAATIERLAEAMNVSPSLVYLAKRVLREGAPEWRGLVMTSDVTLSWALDVIGNGDRQLEAIMILAVQRFGFHEARRIWADSAPDKSNPPR